jgi:hypothetical protein
MAIWQVPFILIPEKVLLAKYEVLPPAIPMELAEDYGWWSSVQPPEGFERKIDLILPQMASWSNSIRMWGQKHGNDACVCYSDESKTKVEEISVRVDARSISTELVHSICDLAKWLRSVLMTADYEILVPDDSMVLTSIDQSRGKKFVDDPISAMTSLAVPKIQERFNRPVKNKEKKSPGET